jgi:hypothetical protein
MESSTGGHMTSSQKLKRFPAYGKKLYQQRLAGRIPSGLYVVLDWNLAKAFPRIVIPRELPLAEIELRFLAGLDVTLAFGEKHADRIPELSQAILQVNPRILNTFNVEIPQNFILKKATGEVFL